MIDKTENENAEQPAKRPCSPADPQFSTETEDNDIIVSEQDFAPGFPVAQMESMHNKIQKTSWVVPVLPNEELETVLLACINLVETSTVIAFFIFNISRSIRKLPIL